MTNYSFAQIFLLLTYFAPFPCIIIGISKYKTLALSLRYVFYLALLALVAGTISIVLWFQSTNNLFVGHIGTVLEFLLIARIYQIELKDFLPKRFFYIIMAVFTVFCIFNTSFLQPYNTNNSYAKTIESILLIGLSIAYFFKLLRDAKVERLEKEPMFWINCAVLMYFSVDIFIFIFSNYMLGISERLATQIWVIHGIFLILFNVICFFALWISNPKN